ncbi:MAG: hypothetical protein A2W90_14690 [Bacteroidetes bacterium GWF2_42_66]|nr:MAG: hypothetical protein A2W92_16085 [Bacteroidetes bacterium GWA2_42_15]OFX99059.1 MAG: hypothetical protein A2W89_06570 [Bacteroidetes bacterium GWE2_42_39]OFY46772.1 MAG: hypothetical protein A2W90_14690 [Bacteroidetes bacterium GWF2_42_66]HAZ04548.1 hypothetical protein [Marinilabiliales bacterium]HBL73819.1 hypothetical protein [Prolixibacteraceae bacterium]
MRQQRNEIPPLVEEIGLGKWHFRWDVQEKTRDDESKSKYFDYNEVELDHKPTATEQKAIKAQYA